jgi:hypothetical protein
VPADRSAAAAYVGCGGALVAPRRNPNYRREVTLRRALLAVFIVACCVAPPAYAGPGTCEGDLQGAIDAIPAGGSGTVTAPPGTCQINTGLTITNRTVTFQADPAGSTLDGANAHRIVKGTDVQGSVFRGLAFINGKAPAGQSGGAILIDGASAPTLTGLRFLNNDATGNGGAVSIASTGTSATVKVQDSTFGDGTSGNANTAGGGGALAIQGTNMEVSGSQFLGNTAESVGGGASLFAQTHTATLSENRFIGNVVQGASTGLRGGGADVSTSPGGSVTLLRNTFAQNQILPSANNVQPTGAGLSLIGFSAPVPVATATGNSFDANTVMPGGGPSQVAPHGGGLSVFGMSLISRDDRFTRNSLPPAVGTGKSWGAGVAISGCSSDRASSTVEDAVVAGNSAAGTSLGTGVYIGCGDGPADLTLRDSTVSGNSVGADTAGVWGGGDDNLTVTNSIIAGNTGGADLTGFGSLAVSFSDACPLPGGTGNLCANPLLVNAAAGDVHETAASPTLDKGSNALIPAGLTTDVFGQPRIQGSAVDMGAAESTVQADKTAPGVSAASLTNKTFAVAKGATAITARKRKKVKRGTTIRYTLTEAAKVTLRFERKLKGRRVKKGKKRVCAKPTRKNRKKRKCTRYKRAGKTLVRTSKAGKNKVKFSGRIAKKALKRGSYRVTIVATDAAGNKSKAKRLNFKIVRG